MSASPPSDLAFDYVVIGSGFGGSVAALRLAEKGYRVAVLEKGKRYRSDQFPKTNWNLRKYLWMPNLGFHGIQQLSLLKHVLILRGVGVGGGSLVYANQLLSPPAEVFTKSEWGGGDWVTRLSPFYDEARRMLGAIACPGVGHADHLLREVGIELRGEDTFHINDVGVCFGESNKTVPDPYFGGTGPDRTGCTLCGACMIGCPTGAKNTLDKNYLYFAEALGVKIIPETEAIGLRPVEAGYEVFTRQTTSWRASKKTFFARGVVVASGVLGSLELLLRSKQRGWLPKISSQLGALVRTNSESILAVDSRRTDTNWNDHIAITSGIYPDPQTHIQIVRYNKGSDLMLGLATLLTDGGGRVPRQIKFLANILRHPLRFVRGLWIPGQSARSSVVLAMQTEDSQLILQFRKRWWRAGGESINSAIPVTGRRAASFIPVANETAGRLARKTGGDAKSTWVEVLFDAPITAHILGGCAMAESSHRGVVGFDGQVFSYPNLYIADASVIPANLGVNPALTITALAEFIMSQIPPRKS